MPKRGLSWAVALFLVVAIAMTPGLLEAHGRKPAPRPVGSVVITGALDQRVLLTFDEFARCRGARGHPRRAIRVAHRDDQPGSRAPAGVRQASPRAEVLSAASAPGSGRYAVC